MHKHDESNDIFQMAARFVNHTGRDIFLTGKAGTGKTTFLKFIKENTYKKTVVVAPTGVAAINAGGVTMHSFFQLPFGPFLPVKSRAWNENVSDQYSLIKNIRFSAEKRELIRELELLVIDEISMVRADMLDAVDTILRHFRNKLSQPFGGVQVLYIGDLFQLPPVAKQDEWNLLSEFYESPFFFHSQVIQQSQPLYIELKKIYRQTEGTFINILNNIRNNSVTNTDLEILHEKYHPSFISRDDEHYITLTTHNYKADEINSTQLNKLPGKLHLFPGKIEKEFSEKALPVEMNLQLKEGAQIMFIKNDKGEIRRFYNGKIGTVKKIIGEKIFVVFPNDPDELELEKETWKNIRYSFDREKNHLNEEEIGTYTQYPIRLAWAITIHKSQGLTFEKAIIDAGDSFAAGQVYVALSRLTGMEGLILYSKILPQSISTDERVLAFSKSELNKELLKENLQVEQKIFISRSLLKFYEWEKLVETFNEFDEELIHRQVTDKHSVKAWAKGLIEKISEQNEVAKKFVLQLEGLLATAEFDNYQHLHHRIESASNFFINALNEIIALIKLHLEENKLKKKTKKYLSGLQTLLIVSERKKIQLKQSIQFAEALMKGSNANDLLELVEKQNEIPIDTTQLIEKIKSTKPKKGDTNRVSFQLFKEGKSIVEIAKLRELAASTIVGHLLTFIPSGEIVVTEILSLQKIELILKVMEETIGESSAAIKEKLGDEFTYSDIRAVMNHKKWLESKNISNSKEVF